MVLRVRAARLRGRCHAPGRCVAPERVATGAPPRASRCPRAILHGAVRAAHGDRMQAARLPAPARGAARVTGGALLLAAGSARRFGADKRRARLAGGLPMLEATLLRYQHAFARLRVVLRAGDAGLAAELAALLRAGDDVVLSAGAEHGMGHSLADGIRGLGWDYAFIGLGDMPFVTVTTLRVLVARMHAALAAGRAAIVQPAFAGALGHPVGFAARHFAALAALTGDRGARAVVMRHAGDHVVVPCLDAGVVTDIDTPAAPGLRRA
jgi:molybdenum cofactor cytidylyltransferase